MRAVGLAVVCVLLLAGGLRAQECVTLQTPNGEITVCYRGEVADTVFVQDTVLVELPPDTVVVVDTLATIDTLMVVDTVYADQVPPGVSGTPRFEPTSVGVQVTWTTALRAAAYRLGFQGGSDITETTSYLLPVGWTGWFCARPFNAAGDAVDQSCNAYNPTTPPDTTTTPSDTTVTPPPPPPPPPPEGDRWGPPPANAPPEPQVSYDVVWCYYLGGTWTSRAACEGVPS